MRLHVSTLLSHLQALVYQIYTKNALRIVGFPTLTITEVKYKKIQHTIQNTCKLDYLCKVEHKIQYHRKEQWEWQDVGVYTLGSGGGVRIGGYTPPPAPKVYTPMSYPPTIPFCGTIFCVLLYISSPIYMYSVLYAIFFCTLLLLF